jgi:RND family efflux transporter MFP subunit
MLMAHEYATCGVYASATMLAVTALGVGCRPIASPPQAAPSVTVAIAQQLNVADWEEFTGRFDAVAAVEIRPRVSGYIARVAFHDGAEVRAGDVLFVIDRRPYAAALARARADLARARASAALARISAERGGPLAANTATAQEDIATRASTLVLAEAWVRSAEAAVEAARLNLSWTEIRSPIAGRVSRAEVTAGNFVLAGPPIATPLTSVVSLDPIYVYFDGDEQTYLKHDALTPCSTAGQPPRGQVFVGLANEDGYPHQGTIDFVDNRLASATGTILVRAVLSNHHHAFTPGLLARVKLVASQPLTAIMVEDRAVGTDRDTKFVYVLGPDSTIAYREVHLGRLVDGLRVVTDGVKPGELIVVNGLRRVQPGAKVRATVEPTPGDSADPRGAALAAGQ